MFLRLRGLAGHSTVYILGEVLRSSLGFVLLPLYTRVLTRDDYGILGLVGPIYGLVSIVMSLGLQASLMRFYFDHEEDRSDLREYVGTISLALMACGVGVAATLTVAGPALFGRLVPGVDFNPYILLTIWNACISLTLIVPLALFRIQEKSKQYVLTTLSDFLLTTGLIVVFVAVLRQGALGNLRAQLLAAGIMAVPAAIVIGRNSRAVFRWRLLVPSLAFGLPLVPHMIGSWVLNVSDRIILDWAHVPTGQIGLYTLGYQFALVLNVIGLALNNVWVPFYYKSSRDRADDPAVPAFITYMVLPMTGLALALALLSREVIQIMADPRFWSAYRVVPLVVLGYLFRYLYFFPVSGLFFSRKTRWVPVATLIAGALNVGLNILLAPRFGIMAAALNTAIGFGVLLAIVAFIGQKRHPVPYEAGRLARIFVVAALLFAIGWLFDPGDLWPRLVFKMLLVGMYPVVLVFTGFLTRPERTRLTQTLRHALARIRGAA